MSGEGPSGIVDRLGNQLLLLLGLIDQEAPLLQDGLPSSSSLLLSLGLTCY